MDNESIFLHNEPCPKCREMGRDKSGDNLGVYSDGHKHCWACGYYRPGSNQFRFLPRTPIEIPTIMLPEGCTTDYSDKALEWVAQYGFSKGDLLRQGVLWGGDEVTCRINKKKQLVEFNQVLIFPVWIEGELLGYNMRYFGDNELVPKWVVKGKLQNVLHILPGLKPLVITEDIMSAMKVNRVGHATMPIYGMHAVSKFKPLRILGHSKVFLWLDPNMYLEMIKQSRVGSLEGLEVIPILSTKDPKEHSLKEIGKYLNV